MIWQSTRILRQMKSGRVFSKSKANKAPGIDGIVYDVLKNENFISLLTNLFHLCYESHKVPDVWLQSHIHPIPNHAKTILAFNLITEE